MDDQVKLILNLVCNTPVSTCSSVLPPLFTLIELQNNVQVIIIFLCIHCLPGQLYFFQYSVTINLNKNYFLTVDFY